MHDLLVRAADIVDATPAGTLPAAVLRDRLTAEYGTRTPSAEELRARLEAHPERFLVLDAGPALDLSGFGDAAPGYHAALHAAGFGSGPRVVLRRMAEPLQPWPVAALRATLLALAELPDASAATLADGFEQLARLRAAC